MHEINMYTKIYLQCYWIKTVWFHSMKKNTRFGTWKTRRCQIFCMHFQFVPHNQNIKKNICLIMTFICCSMNQHSYTCLIRHHYPISHAQYLTHTESLKIHTRCSTLLTVATWGRQLVQCYHGYRLSDSDCYTKTNIKILIIVEWTNRKY